MSMTSTAPHHAGADRRRTGLLKLLGRIMLRDAQARERRLEERDLTIITANLLRLNERQLNRLGFSRATLALDVEDLALRTKRDAELAHDVLRIVEGEDRDTEPAPQRQAIAAQ